MRDAALAKIRNNQAAQQQKPEGFDGTCAECEEFVDPRRLALNYFTCVDCATARERQQTRTP